VGGGGWEKGGGGVGGTTRQRQGCREGLEKEDGAWGAAHCKVHGSGRGRATRFGTTAIATGVKLTCKRAESMKNMQLFSMGSELTQNIGTIVFHKTMLRICH